VKKYSIAWLIVGLSVLLNGLFIYLFIVKGTTVPSTDNRFAIVLTPGERDLVLSEMRAFLSAVQQISQGIANKDMATIKQASQSLGMAATTKVPVSLMGKLPLEFKKLGFGTHEAFDQLAQDMVQMDDTAVALERLPVLLGGCVACHASYQIITDATQVADRNP
jgi:hypothetical protein